MGLDIKTGGTTGIVARGSDQEGNEVATVQAGETRLADVAARIGVDEQSLLQANPQIQDPSHLKAGQDIRLPSGSKDPWAGSPKAGDARVGRSIHGTLKTVAKIALPIAGAAIKSVERAGEKVLD